MDLGIPIANDKAQFLRQLIATLETKKLPNEQLVMLKVFAGEFFDQYPMGDLEGKALDDIAGMILHAFEFVITNNKTKAKIEVMNPSIDREGWQTQHTIVMVHCANMPFLMDSVRLALGNHDVTLHSIKSTPLMVRRDETGAADDILSSVGSYYIEGNEALLYFELTHQSQVKDLKAIESAIRTALADISRVVSTYEPIQASVEKVKLNLSLAPRRYKKEEVTQVVQFLDWLMTNSFTFLGYAYFSFDDKQRKQKTCKEAFGLLQGEGYRDFISDALLSGKQNRAGLLNFSKSPMRSTVHRRAYPDHIIIKGFDESGKLVGEHHFIGLYTSGVYRASVLNIPVIREKVHELYNKINTNISSYNGKTIRQVLETYPRDELFQSDVDELTHTLVDISQINERHHVRLFMRQDWVGEFAYAMMYIPREIFSSRLRSRIVAFISEAVGAESSDFYTYYSESVLSRTYIIFKQDKQQKKTWDVAALEKQVQEFSRTWQADFEGLLDQHYGGEKAKQYLTIYGQSFSSAYQENFHTDNVLSDINIIESLDDDKPTGFNLAPISDADNQLRFQVFNKGATLALSDIIPIFERMGLTVLGEHPYKIKTQQDDIWLHDFTLKSPNTVQSSFADLKAKFESAFSHIWHGHAENDEFNSLVLNANIHWREALVLRAYAAYMKQTLFPFSASAIVGALNHYPKITQQLVSLFHHYFDPEQNSTQSITETDILTELDAVTNLTEDRILRRFLDLIKGTVRTNFYQRVDGKAKDYVSFKLTPREIAEIPEPRPLYEIFVYSTRVEGVHLRGGKVARGGLRWSDRFEDFRTEVLGLVKAQQVKNAVIVPNGAKGGFVAKQANMNNGRDAFFKEGVSCYQTFIRGLLDVTDNLIDGNIIPPINVRRRDDDDPYLVVAADKGTATFSDIANAISDDYGHWLGDAFASGGSQGYDHKGMGITARGAWVSVQRHFKEKGIDIQKEDFTVVGVGDMAGDVFGNGMLLSKHICLTAAFNHLHIFIDPTPNAAKSFKERERLFNTPGVSWEDYSKKLISKGGGIFSRNAKSIPISGEMKKRFGIHASSMTPNDLIHALLQAPVDMIWNGGIGTYVKSRKETHADIGDKANDSLRVNGADLRCQVFGEGGNLGLSQQGRIEFCANGGACNTDFIDNAAGVDCSDHEVNIKILLNDVMSKEKLSTKQRNRLLESMTDSVAEMVLRNNYLQTQSITTAEKEAVSRMGEYRRLINHLEEIGVLNRELEFIPSDDELLERKAVGKGLTRPELSVLNCYVKVLLKEQLNTDEVANSPYLVGLLERAFPQKLVKKYSDYIHKHILKKEIIATQLANDMVNNMGITFCHRLIESTGEEPSAIALAYIAARDVFGFDVLQKEVESLDYKVPAEDQITLLLTMVGRVRRGTRWFLRNRRDNLDLKKDVTYFKDVVQTVVANTPNELSGNDKQVWDDKKAHFMSLGLSPSMAEYMSMPGHLFSGLGIAETALQGGSETKHAVAMHHLLGDKLGLYWFAHAVTNVAVENYWQAMARESFIDDIDKSLRIMSVALLKLKGNEYQTEEAMQLWMQKSMVQVTRWRNLANELQNSVTPDFAMFSVAMRELSDMVDACSQCQGLDF